MNLSQIALILQIICAVVVGAYFIVQLSNHKTVKNVSRDSNSSKEMEKLSLARAVKLTQPLSEKIRPAALDDVVGQAEGIKALRAALCSSNPQHVLIYGPPGIGKTCAARLMLEEAKRLGHTPFHTQSPFIEVDATCVRFDERSIADPLIGSVHDPIYQGAGAMGQAGVPQPKPGAVSRAHGGVLFLDEIGELHPMQMNKLLKVLEDRKVNFDSAYYSPDDKNIPTYIHDIFAHGMPADFRLIGATTRQPSDIPPAIRSRCLEIYFRSLNPAELASIACRAALKSGLLLDDSLAHHIAKYSQSGRDAVNIVQLAASVAMNQDRKHITLHDISWVVQVCRYHANLERKMPAQKQVGLSCGMAVTPDGTGVLLEVEVAKAPGSGKVNVTGIVEEEEISGANRKLRRRSTASTSVDNVLCLLKQLLDVDLAQYDLHINFPGGIPVDGPSAGVAIALAVASCLSGQSMDNTLCATGEISIRGDVKPVGGVCAKAEAAAQAGARRVLVPMENLPEALNVQGVEVIGIQTLQEALALAFELPLQKHAEQDLLSAASCAV